MPADQQIQHINPPTRRLARTLKTLSVVAAAVTIPVLLVAALTGAIYTSLSDGTIVNQNMYNFRTDVYLNGGPQNQNGAGLPDGVYFFQVTDPNGNVLLSLDDAICRQLQVVGGVISGAAGPCPHPNGIFNSSNGSTSVQLAPFDFTPNPGGEYKVWLISQTGGTTIDPDNSRALIFSNPDSKTDNFKVRETSTCPTPESCQPLLPQITGAKFYDTNTNGIWDSGEPGIPGWQIVLFGAASNNTTTVPVTGTYSFINLAGGTYGVCEVIPSNSTPLWVPTKPTAISPITVPPDSTGNNFGNVCLGTGGGMTLGFWSNKNGQAILNQNDPAWRTLLNSLNLRNAAGANYDVPAGAFSTAYPNFRSWLLGASATNMAYMLSAQLTAMELNVFSGKVEGTSTVYAGAAPANCSVPGLSATGFISISDLMLDANSASNYSLLASPLTTASGNARSCQQFMKNTLDDANNNKNFVQGAGQCDVNYSGLEKSCAP